MAIFKRDRKKQVKRRQRPRLGPSGKQHSDGNCNVRRRGIAKKMVREKTDEKIGELSRRGQRALRQGIGPSLIG